MTATRNPPGPRRGLQLQPPDGALVRVTVTDPMEPLPPAPAGADVSVSFSSAAASAAAGADLQAWGYRVVGIVTGALPGEPAADLLVAQDVIDAHPQWWRALAERADRAFNLTAGPVRAAFGDVLRAHQQGWS